MIENGGSPITHTQCRVLRITNEIKFLYLLKDKMDGMSIIGDVNIVKDNRS